jgi:hypothetical protein
MGARDATSVKARFSEQAENNVESDPFVRSQNVIHGAYHHPTQLM